jgi:hypothetical protein
MPRQSEAELQQLLRDLNKSFGANRKLILFDETQANMTLLLQYKANVQQLGTWVTSRYGNEEAPFTLERLRRAVVGIHKSDPSILKWMDGKRPLPPNVTGSAKFKEDAPQGNVANSQGDLVARQEADRKAKVDATTLANAQGRCANITGRFHGETATYRSKCLAEFKRLSALPGATADSISKGVDIFISDLTKVKSAGPRIHGI